MQGLVTVNGVTGDPARASSLVKGDVVTVAGQSVRVAELGARLRSAYVEQVHHEDQRLPGVDHATRAAVAIPEMRRDHRLAPATTFMPATPWSHLRAHPEPRRNDSGSPRSYDASNCSPAGV